MFSKGPATSENISKCRLVHHPRESIEQMRSTDPRKVQQQSYYYSSTSVYYRILLHTSAYSLDITVQYMHAVVSHVRHSSTSAYYCILLHTSAYFLDITVQYVYAVVSMYDTKFHVCMDAVLYTSKCIVVERL